MPEELRSYGPLSKVVVTGAGGQLGAALCASSSSFFNPDVNSGVNPDVNPDVSVTGLRRDDCDISDAVAVAAMLDALQPQLLVNAAAYTAVDRAEDDVAAAYAANASAPGILASACSDRGIRFFHVSTDFVFDGSLSSPYPVDSPTQPLGVYGKSKRDGERAVSDANADALILRTGWVYSHRGQNFLRTMLRLHESRDHISVVADQVGTPTDAHSLAQALWAAAERPGLAGTYHWSDAGVCSWYDFAVAIGEEATALGVLQKAATVTPIRTQDYPTPAVRPAYSVLDKTLSWRDFEITPKHWRSQLRTVLLRLKEAERG